MKHYILALFLFAIAIVAYGHETATESHDHNWLQYQPDELSKQPTVAEHYHADNNSVKHRHKGMEHGGDKAVSVEHVIDAHNAIKKGDKPPDSISKPSTESDTHHTHLFSDIVIGVFLSIVLGGLAIVGAIFKRVLGRIPKVR